MINILGRGAQINTHILVKWEVGWWGGPLFRRVNFFFQGEFICFSPHLVGEAHFVFFSFWQVSTLVTSVGSWPTKQLSGATAHRQHTYYKLYCTNTRKPASRPSLSHGQCTNNFFVIDSLERYTTLHTCTRLYLADRITCIRRCHGVDQGGVEMVWPPIGSRPSSIQTALPPINHKIISNYTS